MNSSESSGAGKSPEPEKAKAESPQAGGEGANAGANAGANTGANAGASPSGQQGRGGAGATSSRASDRRQRRFMTLVRLRQRYSFKIVLLVAFVILIAAAFWPRVFYVVNSGQTGVLYRFFWGTQTSRTYGEGLTILFPWNSLFIYDVREQERSEDVEVLSYNGLIISVGLSYRFQPDADKVALIHQRLGPDYTSKLVQPLLQSTVREVIGNYRPEELFTTHSATLQEEIGQIAQRKIEPYFIRINQIFVKRVKLPEMVENAIQDKLVLQQVAEGYDFRLVSEERERQRKLIESDGIRQYNANIAGSLTSPVLRYMSIRAMERLATSSNSKVVVLGGKEGEGLMLPLMMNDLNGPATPAQQAANGENARAESVHRENTLSGMSLGTAPAFAGNAGPGGNAGPEGNAAPGAEAGQGAVGGASRGAEAYTSAGAEARPAAPGSRSPLDAAGAPRETPPGSGSDSGTPRDPATGGNGGASGAGNNAAFGGGSGEYATFR